MTDLEQERSLWEADVDQTFDPDAELEKEMAAVADAFLPAGTSVVVNEPADSYPVIRFKVPGRPAPQGSKVAFNRKNKAGQVVGNPIMRESSQRVAPYRSDVVAAASAAMADHDLLTGPLILDVVFVYSRPKGHFNAKGELNKAGHAMPAPIAKNLGDLSKLVRSIEDAMTGVVFGDDSQITTLAMPRKRWGMVPATYITIQPDPVLK